MNCCKIVLGLLVLCGVLMLAMGFGVLSLPVLNPPIVSGVGFLLVAFAMAKHKH